MCGILKNAHSNLEVVQLYSDSVLTLSLSLGVGGCCCSDILLSGTWVWGAPGALQLQPFHKQLLSVRSDQPETHWVMGTCVCLKHSLMPVSRGSYSLHSSFWIGFNNLVYSVASENVRATVRVIIDVSCKQSKKLNCPLPLWLMVYAVDMISRSDWHVSKL